MLEDSTQDCVALTGEKDRESCGCEAPSRWQGRAPWFRRCTGLGIARSGSFHLPAGPGGDFSQHCWGWGICSSVLPADSSMGSPGPGGQRTPVPSSITEHKNRQMPRGEEALLQVPLVGALSPESIPERCLGRFKRPGFPGAPES